MVAALMRHRVARFLNEVFSLLGRETGPIGVDPDRAGHTRLECEWNHTHLDPDKGFTPTGTGT